MIICGVKVSHDGGVAVIDSGRLLFSVEVEKLANGRRYSSLGDLARVGEILREEGVDPRDVDRFVVDGWYPEPGDDAPLIHTLQHGEPVRLPVAPYVNEGPCGDSLHRRWFAGVGAGPLNRGYASYTHGSGHVLAGYSTSPFARQGEDALVLAWDGGMLPRLYHVASHPFVVEALGPLVPLLGDVFVHFCMELGPFRRDLSTLAPRELTQHHLEVPGKAMAYAALGAPCPEAFAALEAALDELTATSLEASVGRRVAERRGDLFPGLSDADLIATFQAYVGHLLAQSLGRMMRRRFGGRPQNLCLAGGCALNIKWNSQLRDSGLFREIWVPPFPNDAGAAIGAACCEMVRETGVAALEWDVYSGPRLRSTAPAPGWSARACDERQLAAVLHQEREPVVVLDGRAELGPRALGNRSILAPATSPAMKDRLNDIKGRASYRPVAPVCLAARAAEVFDPGGSDPYMLFEHRLRPGWAERIPAIVHLDGSARLQTLDPAVANTRTGRILQEYERLSGIPVLCNTSANASGHGLFADVEAATRWGRTRYVWAGGILFTGPAAPAPVLG